jgi:hypothetical protein
MAELSANGSVCWSAVGSLECDWIWYVRFLGSSLTGALGFAATLALALLGRQRPARTVLLATFWLYTGCLLAAVAGEIAGGAGMWTAGEAVRCYLAPLNDLAFLVPFTVLSLGMTVAQRSPVSVLVAFAVVHIATSAIRTSVIAYQLDGNKEDVAGQLQSNLVGPQLLALALALGLVLFRRKAVWEARRLVRGDAALYTAAWAELVAQPGTGALLDELRGLLKGYRPVKGRRTRQMYRRGPPIPDAERLPLPTLVWR